MALLTLTDVGKRYRRHGTPAVSGLSFTVGHGEILALLEGIYADGATVVIVTHDASISSRTPRRIAIRDGAIESDLREAS